MIKEKTKNNTAKNKDEKNDEKKPPIKAVKRFSCMLPDMNLINKPTPKKEDNNPKPKKLDPNRIKMLGMLGGQRIIGQMSINSNEIQREKTEKEIDISPSINQKDNKTTLLHANTTTENDKKELTQKNVSNYFKDEKRNTLVDRNTAKKKVAEAFGFEILDNEDNFLKPSLTINTPEELSLPKNTLESINYEEYLSKLNLEGKNEIPHETFCEGFFLASFPEKNGQVIENSSKFPATCGHKTCSELPSMKPEIIYRYPLNDTNNLELNNLAATICFPTGIKMCYGETHIPKQIKDYVTQITNQKGERYYMRTFHFYKKMDNIIFTKKYEIHPLKHHLSRFADAYQFLKDEDYTDEIVEEIQKNLEFCENLGFKDFVYIPCCICLISKYPFYYELKKCLNSIYNVISATPGLLSFEINDLIMFLIHSIPIPEKNMRIQFFIPYNPNPKIELQCPKKDDISIMNSNFIGLFKYFCVDNIILIFRLLLSEKKILFIHDDYTELTNITNSFISLLYPFKWIHTYIPIMSDQMLKYLETFLPFVSGIHVSLMKFVENIFIENEVEDNEDVFLIYIKQDQIILSSYFKTNKNKLYKYLQSSIPLLPYERELKKDLKNIDVNSKEKKEIVENKIRDAFINIFVKMFYDYEKYIVNLNNDVVFNKVLFMQNIPNKEEKTDLFFDEFIDCQLFQQFTQNVINKNENKYFKQKIIEYKEKMQLSKDRRNIEKSTNQKEIVYLATPYLGFNSQNQKGIKIETILNNHNYIYKNQIPKNEEAQKQAKILENDLIIDSNKYINSKCIIYLNPITPGKKHKSKEEKYKNENTLNIAGELNEKQIDQIQENIKDTVVNIFKSQIENGENKALKKKVFSNLETAVGRLYFISLISNNTNIVSLQENSFLFLEELIKGILNSVLKLEENEQLLEEIVVLILSTKSFEVEITDKNGMKESITIFKKLKNFLKNYSKITQKNLWKKWYDVILKKNKKDNINENDIKEKIILVICQNMINLEISKSIVKNVVESINKIAFGEESEIYKEIEKKYKDLIIKANYISKANQF